MSYKEDCRKIINKMNIKKSNKIDTTKDLYELITCYLDGTKDKLDEDTFKITISEVLGETPSPFYLSFCDQVIPKIVEYNYKIQNDWIKIKNHDANEKETIQFLIDFLYFQEANMELSIRIKDNFGINFIREGSKLDLMYENQTHIHNDWLYYDTSDEFYPMIEYFMELENTLTEFVSKNVKDTTSPSIGNYFSYCSATIFPFSVLNRFVYLRKKELEKS